MARSSFFGGRNGEMGGEGAMPISTGPLTAFIDQGSSFEGKLSFQDTVRIDGRFQGEISSQNTLIVGETGEIEANVKSRNVVISGRVVGNVCASHQLVLHKTARLEGDAETGSLMVEEGAVVNGRITMHGNGDAGSGSSSYAASSAASADRESEPSDSDE